MSELQSFQVEKGSPLNLGIFGDCGGINFSLFVHQAQNVTLHLFLKPTDPPIAQIPLFQTGEIWHAYVKNLPADLIYAFEIKKEDGSHYTKVLDPYAKSLTSTHIWGKSGNYAPSCAHSSANTFDWQNVKSPHLPLQNLVIYEMHVRGFTQHPSSQVSHPGQFLGVIEKIPHLIDLGINAVELLPIQEFNENEYQKLFPNQEKQLYNYWGYSTVNFFSPMKRYASEENSGVVIQEFKTMVRELHRHGIEVIIDVVFNHTAEGGKKKPGFCFRALADEIYYIQDEEKQYKDYTGCGNTVNSNHPVVREFILDCLRYWVVEMHVDGFRFDLASALTRDEQGIPVPLPPAIEAISEDPILSKVKLIAEPWDAGMLYQVGDFYPQKNRWCEWNGRYRDSIRRFIKGTDHQKGEFATRISGSSDMYGNGRAPTSSINFINVHDGFTLRDLVSYNMKDNLSNGEDNRDGTNDNDSWNCGEEGVTENAQILQLRERQMRNFHLILMLSQGIPMLLMGDEYGHTKKGNNNTWCQDNELNWFLWDQLKNHNAFYRYYKELIHFRHAHPILQRSTFLEPDDIDWHGEEPFQPQWEVDNRFIAFTLKNPNKKGTLYAAFNADGFPIKVHIPASPLSTQWYWIVNTSKDSPDDFLENPIPMNLEHYEMPPYSALLLEAK
ncbi:isoamylase 3, chloroplastic [Parachlamydia acanthamoebae UV-7]|uniref:Isoamylase 3, chloroplastic n=1 Tax=Parachlamydia acanthamoebae (strain UV7) TaxID=765952 RepID=F8L072_PARAV|nr:isoamylase [Parachlamydia acanthamoebae]CCB86602.1 isoamylase 3, chloroplastic [Parachlamydia acanthamoebae UV-7]